MCIIWLGQRVQVLFGLFVNQYLEVERLVVDLLIVIVGNLIEVLVFEVFLLQYEENFYEDYEKEKFMFEWFLQEGLVVLYEDLNVDGIKDLFIGGVYGYLMCLLQGQVDGLFQNLEVDVFICDVGYEDVSFVVIDFDVDGDLDFYVVSGGGVAKELEKVLEDWLYFNNGNMDFCCVQFFLFYINGSVVVVVDFNKDGYEDIFVGVCLILGFYGLFFYSFILINRQGMGVDIVYK